MHHNLVTWGVRAFALTMVAIATFLSAPRVEAVPLHVFCVDDTCTDGIRANEMVKAPSGKIYGTTNGGGAHGHGTIFKLTPNAGTYDYQVIYSFCSQPACADGREPLTELTVDQQDRLYGTTSHGGGKDDGVAFRFDPGTGDFTIMHSFCSAPSCADGAWPNGNSGSHERLTYEGQESGALYDGTSPLYGTTIIGGSANSGVVFKLVPALNGRHWRHVVIHSFCIEGNGCPNGYAPNYLGFDGKGHLIGVANGGTGEAGILYRMSTRGTETVLYNFCASGEPCTDGRGPGAFTLNSKGQIVGVTSKGGVGDNQASYNFGRLYKYAHGAAVAVNDFCAEYHAIGHCEDGADPLGGLSQANGAIYGTTEGGGPDAFDSGTIYRLKGLRYETIGSFCATDCPDGFTPTSGVVLDDAGNIIGSTRDGASDRHAGAIFMFSPEPR